MLPQTLSLAASSPRHDAVQFGLLPREGSLHPSNLNGPILFPRPQVGVLEVRAYAGRRIRGGAVGIVREMGYSYYWWFLLDLGEVLRHLKKAKGVVEVGRQTMFDWRISEVCAIIRDGIDVEKLVGFRIVRGNTAWVAGYCRRP